MCTEQKKCNNPTGLGLEHRNKEEKPFIRFERVEAPDPELLSKFITYMNEKE
jgi:hypothetical protein